jgi:hypothetical protein
MCLKNMADASVRGLSNTGNLFDMNLFNKQLSKISAVRSAWVGWLVSELLETLTFPVFRQCMLRTANVSCWMFVLLCGWVTHPPLTKRDSRRFRVTFLCLIFCPFFINSFTYVHYCFVYRGTSEIFASCPTLPTISYVTVMYRVTFVTHSDKHDFDLPPRSVVFEVCLADPKCSVPISQGSVNTFL